MSNRKDDALFAFLAGLAGGALAGLAIAKLVESAPVPCPVCLHPVKRGTSICPHCRTGLRWE